MKKLLIICLFAIIGNWTTVYSQENVPMEKPVLTVEQQQAVDAIVAMDPKLSAEEIENLKLAVMGAPVDAEPISDPKLDTPPDESVHAPWKAEPIEERDDVFSKPVEQPLKQTAQTGQQPEPAKSENVVKYRQTNGPAEQIAPAKPENAVKYRKVNGPQTQPSGNPNGN